MKKLFLVFTFISLSQFCFSDKWNNFLEIGQPAERVELYTDGTYKIEDKDAYGWWEVRGTYSIKNFVLTFNFMQEIVHKRNNFPIEKAKSIDELYYPEPIVRGNAGKFKISLWCIEYPDSGLDDGISRDKK